MSNSWHKIIFFFGLALVLPVSGISQNALINPKINSPYSRYGLGDPVDPNFAVSGGMGGLRAAFQDPLHLNIQNPASLANLLATAFEIGLYSKYSNLKEGDASTGMWSGNLNYLALGFPLRNPINQALDRKVSPFGWGMSFSLQPFTLVGYDINTILEDEQIGVINNRFKGNGGTYRFYYGNAARYKNLSIGLNIGYLFGKLTNSRRIELDSLEFSYSTEFLDEFSVGGFIWNAGVQYSHDFKQKNAKGELEPSGKRLIVGLFGNSAQDFRTTGNRLYSREFVYSASTAVLDTLVFEENARKDGRLPAEFTVGIAYEQANKWKIGVEYSAAQWSGYLNEAKPESLSDSWRIAAGLEFIPDYASYNNYFQRLRYRLGVFYSTDPRGIGAEQLKDFGLTLGMGLPIVMPRQQVSFINLAAQVGQFGIPDQLKETYVRFTLGFTLNDNTWFFKRKFN